MTPARKWAMENAPATCQATARAAFEAGVRAFAKFIEEELDMRIYVQTARKNKSDEALSDEFLAGKEEHNVYFDQK
jgi:hypothetical protein